MVNCQVIKHYENQVKCLCCYGTVTLHIVRVSFKILLNFSSGINNNTAQDVRNCIGVGVCVVNVEERND